MFGRSTHSGAPSYAPRPSPAGSSARAGPHRRPKSVAPRQCPVRRRMPARTPASPAFFLPSSPSFLLRALRFLALAPHLVPDRLLLRCEKPGQSLPVFGEHGILLRPPWIERRLVLVHDGGELLVPLVVNDGRRIALHAIQVQLVEEPVAERPRIRRPRRAPDRDAVGRGAHGRARERGAEVEHERETLGSGHRGYSLVASDEQSKR